MNKTHYMFIIGISAYIHSMSQIPRDVCDFIGCQFSLESSYGESSLAHTNHNLCGMRNPLVRLSSAIHAGDANYHWAQYEDDTSCCYDFLLCLQYHKPLSVDYDTIAHYSRFISKFYCPEKDYIDKINLIYQHFKSYKNGSEN